MRYVVCLLAAALILSWTQNAPAEEPSSAGTAKVEPTDLARFRGEINPFLETYCLDCHAGEEAEAGFRLDNIDGLVTAGNDIERWEKTLEMISIGDMPPEEAGEHPDKSSRRAIEQWIGTELKKIGRGPDDARLARPAFGNRVDHEELFSGEHVGPAFSPPRIWRKNTYIHERFETSLRLPQGNSPFPLKGGHGFQDYSLLPATQSTITTLRINGKNYITEWLDGKLVHPPGPDGKPDRSKQVREGRSRFSEFERIINNDEPLDAVAVEKAVQRSFDLLLYRQPSEAEIQRYGHEFLVRSIEIAGRRLGLENMLTAIILTPEFVYRQEVGLGEELPDGRRMLSPNEIAYALAYALTDSPPDDQLRKAVEEGRLSTKDDVAREVRRMLTADTHTYWSYEINHTFERHVNACPNPRVLRFFREFFGYDRVFEVFKDKSRNQQHKPEFLFKDADLFVLSILEEDQQVFRKLLTSDRYVVHYVNEEQAQRKLTQYRESKDPKVKEQLASGKTPVLGGYRGGEYYSAYGFEKETWDYPMEQPFKVSNRAGMLTHPAWLVAHSGNFDTDPIRRGKWIREHLLADTIPEIPIGVDAALVDDPHKTLRERLAKTSAAECWRCHKKMNPLGLPFESFDDFGRYRKQFYFDDNDEFAGTYFERMAAIKYRQQRKQPPIEYTTRPIDTSGQLAGTGDPELDGEVADAFDLVHRLADSDLARQSFIRHAFRYWMGRNETLDDSQTLIAADRAYVESDGSFKELLVSLLTSDSFLMRRENP